MHTALPPARQRLLELLRLTPQTDMVEGYLMALQNAFEEYVRTILYGLDEADKPRSG